jgi:PKD repeat protein
LDSIASPVTTSPGTVSGQGKGNTIVRLYLDDEEALSFVMFRDSPFSMEIEVGAGEHEIYAVAEDQAENKSQPSNIVAFTSEADITPPTTTITITETPEKATIELSAEDNPGGSGVTETKYAFSDSTEWLTYTEPFEVSREEEVIIWYHSIDNAENSEGFQHATITGTLQADFEADNTKVVEGRPVQFTNLSSGGVPDLSYEWDFNNDEVIDSTDENPSYTYDTAGTYTVSLKVTDAEENTDIEVEENYISVSVVSPGDVNRDGKVDDLDLSVVAAAFNSVSDDLNYNPNADLNEDGIVDIYDLVIVGKNFGAGG